MPPSEMFRVALLLKICAEVLRITAISCPESKYGPTLCAPTSGLAPRNRILIPRFLFDNVTPNHNWTNNVYWLLCVFA